MCTQIPNPPRVEISRASSFGVLELAFRFVFLIRFDGSRLSFSLRGVVFSFTFDTVSRGIVRVLGWSRLQTATLSFGFPQNERLVPVHSTTYRSVRSWIRGFVDSWIRVVDFIHPGRSRVALASRRLFRRIGLTRGRGIFFENYPSVSRQKLNRIGLLLIVCRPGERRKFGEAGYTVGCDDADARSGVSGGAETVGGVAGLGRRGCAVRQL